jgi:hypothetical protein
MVPIPSILELRIQIQDVLISNLPDPQHCWRNRHPYTHSVYTGKVPVPLFNLVGIKVQRGNSSY